MTNFSDEINDKQSVKSKRDQNLKKLANYFYRLDGSKWCARKAKQLNLSDQSPLRFPTDGELKDTYQQITYRLNHKYRETLQRNQLEIDWFKLISNNSRFDFHRTVWIGNHNFDVFTASLSLRNKVGVQLSHGLVLEINGPIHDSEAKMKKDSYADESLNRLKIGLFRINSTHTGRYIAEMLNKETKVTDSRERRRIWKKIYLETILSHGTPDEIEKLFNISSAELFGGV